MRLAARPYLRAVKAPEGINADRLVGLFGLLARSAVADFRKPGLADTSACGHAG